MTAKVPAISVFSSVEVQWGLKPAYGPEGASVQKGQHVTRQALTKNALTCMLPALWKAGTSRWQHLAG